MPWKVDPVPELRFAFVQLVRTAKIPISVACRQFSICRTTGYKWLKRYDLNSTSGSTALCDHSRRPHRSPDRTSSEIESKVLALRDRSNWGPRKIHRCLAASIPDFPSIRTCANILKRHGRVDPPSIPPAPPQLFERPEPNQLWQCDFKGPLEIQRRRVAPFTVLDDCSRYLLALRAGFEQTVHFAWEILWDVFGEVGLPDSILCDHAFGCTAATYLPSISWFESRLLRLDVRCLHGRPYHPQTQGKVERIHRTFDRELWPRTRRDCLENFNADCERWRRCSYNLIRPHESLGDAPPITRYRPSPRKRPARLPDLSYPMGAELRKVSSVGDIRWKKYRILVGRGVAGDLVHVEEQDSEIVVYYARHLIRRIAHNALKPATFI